MKITKTTLMQLIQEEYKKILTEVDEVPPLDKAGMAAEKAIQAVLPAIQDATGDNDQLKQMVLQRLLQLLQKEGGEV